MTSISTTANKSKKQTKDEKIYHKIYSAIMDRQLPPDTKLPEDSLADSFNVSRTIIRKVLLTLAHEGLVFAAPKRVARVAHPSIKESKEVFEARRVIEVSALPLIINNITESDLKGLYDLDQQQQAAEKAQDAKKVIRIAGDFHLSLMQSSGNSSLCNYLRKLISSTSLIEDIYGRPHKHYDKCEGHSELLDYIANKEIDKSKQWMDDHLIKIENSLDFTEPAPSKTNLKKIFS